MTTVSYAHPFEYGYDDDGRRLPLLKLRLTSVKDPGLRVDLEAALDSGAERTLLDGQIGVALGLDLLSGPSLAFETMGGGILRASLQDFFDLVQIGFREHHLTFFVTPAP